MQLWKISHALRTLFDTVEENEGVLTDENFAEIESLELALSEKIEGCAVMITEMDSYVNVLKEQEERLRARRKSFENRVAWLRRYLAAYLPEGGYKCAMFSISRRKTVSVDIPEGFAVESLHDLGFAKQVTEYKPDKALIKTHLQELGEGAALVDENGNSITLKTNIGVAIR